MENDDEFVFESSHLALRCNTDYLKLMKHLAILCSLRNQVHKNYEIIDSQFHKAISDPVVFLENLKNGTISFPDEVELLEVSGTFLKFSRF